MSEQRALIPAVLLLQGVAVTIWLLSALFERLEG